MVVGTVRFAQEAQDVEQQQVLQRNLDRHALQLHQALIALGDAETGQRGYLLTGKSSYLEPYDAAVRRMPTLLAGLDAMASNDPQLASHTARIRALSAQKLAEMAQTIRLHDGGDPAAALGLVLTGQGQHYMDDLRSEASAVEQAIELAHNRLDSRVAQGLERSWRLAVLVVSVLGVFIALCTLQVGVLLVSRSRSGRALARSEAFLNRAGRVAGVGGWELDLRSDEVRWSDQSRRILEVDDDDAPTVEAMFSFFPADAHARVRDAIFAARYQGIPFDLELPLVTRAGSSLIVRILGETERDSKGEPAQIIGSLQDITARKLIEERLRDLTEVVEGTSDFVVKTDWQGFVTYVNPAARAFWHGVPEEALLGGTFMGFATPESNARFLNEIRPAVKAAGVWLGEATVLVGDRHVPANTLVIGHRGSDGRITRYSAVMRDISAIVAAREEVARQTATLQSVVEAFPAMVAVVDRQLRYRMVNRSFERWRGVRREAVIGRGVVELFGQEEYDKSWPWVERALAGETVQYEKDYPGERNKHLSVTYVPLRLEDGTIDGLIAVLQDITHHREEKIRLLDLTERDVLTGLLNRAGLHKYLSAHIESGSAASVALLYIDLDHFKPVNDQHGHAVGDELLQQFAQRMQLLVRGSDAVARLGGDEFAIALAGVNTDTGARAVARKVLEAAATPFLLRDMALQVSASVGVALNADDAAGLAGLIERADARLYEAKAAGRQRMA